MKYLTSTIKCLKIERHIIDRHRIINKKVIKVIE